MAKSPNIRNVPVSAVEALKLMGIDPDRAGPIDLDVLIDKGGPRPVRRRANFRKRAGYLHTTLCDTDRGTARYVDGKFLFVIFLPAEGRLDPNRVRDDYTGPRPKQAT